MESITAPCPAPPPSPSYSLPPFQARLLLLLPRLLLFLFILRPKLSSFCFSFAFSSLAPPPFPPTSHPLSQTSLLFLLLFFLRFRLESVWIPSVPTWHLPVLFQCVFVLVWSLCLYSYLCVFVSIKEGQVPAIAAFKFALYAFSVCVIFVRVHVCL